MIIAEVTNRITSVEDISDKESMHLIKFINLIDIACNYCDEVILFEYD